MYKCRANVSQTHACQPSQTKRAHSSNVRTEWQHDELSVMDSTCALRQADLLSTHCIALLVRETVAQVCRDYSVAGGSQIASRFGDNRVLDGIVEQLREIQRGTGLERTLAVGRVVLSSFFAENPELWRDRRRNKNNSIRRLAERPDCPFCKSALNEAVGVYVAVVALPCIRTFGHITASHIAATLILTEQERSDVLEHAERECWSVRQIKQYVVEMRRTNGERRGRPTASDDARALTSLKSVLSSLSSAVAQVMRLQCISGSTRAALEPVINELSRQVALLEQWVVQPTPSSRRGNVVSIERRK